MYKHNTCWDINPRYIHPSPIWKLNSLIFMNQPINSDKKKTLQYLIENDKRAGFTKLFWVGLPLPRNKVVIAVLSGYRINCMVTTSITIGSKTEKVTARDNRMFSQTLQKGSRCMCRVLVDSSHVVTFKW